MLWLRLIQFLLRSVYSIEGDSIILIDLLQLPCDSLDNMNTIFPGREMAEFWEASRPWMAAKGIKLYETYPLGPGNSVWVAPQNRPRPAGLPYASCVYEESEAVTPRTIPILASALMCRLQLTNADLQRQKRLACGRDSSGQDVMLKLVAVDTPQYEIFQNLMQEKSVFLSSGTFPCIVPPLEIYDTQHWYSVVSMPTCGLSFYVTF